MSTPRSTVSGSLTDENTVASVGPYALNSDRPAPHRSTSSALAASPPVTTTFRSSRPDGSTDANAAGVTNAWVTDSPDNTAANSEPPYTSVGAITSVPAPPKASSTSSTDASKLVDANASTRESVVTRKRDRSSSTKSPSPRCVTTTPFGTPVDPEV